MSHVGLGSPAVLSWFGNMAKMRIIQKILSNPGPKTIFDYGAGKGGGWAETLDAHPEVTLICYEPSPAAKVLKECLPTATVLSEEEFQNGSVRADYVVSFSVFEHVFDRRAYLSNAKRNLAEGGTLFLNYDDGHFRKALDLPSPATWAGPLREHLVNLAAPILPRIGMVGRYQERVVKTEADTLVSALGLTIQSARYENLSSLKSLSARIPVPHRADFAEFWLATEDSLNERFSAEATRNYLGDNNVLWAEMGSRTLEIVHSRSTGTAESCA